MQGEVPGIGVQPQNPEPERQPGRQPPAESDHGLSDLQPLSRVGEGAQPPRTHAERLAAARPVEHVVGRHDGKRAGPERPPAEPPARLGDGTAVNQYDDPGVGH